MKLQHIQAFVLLTTLIEVCIIFCILHKFHQNNKFQDKSRIKLSKFKIYLSWEERSKQISFHAEFGAHVISLLGNALPLSYLTSPHTMELKSFFRSPLLPILFMLIRLYKCTLCQIILLINSGLFTPKDETEYFVKLK